MNVYINQYNTNTEINLLPLAAGMLAAEARADPIVGCNVRLEIQVDRLEPQAAVERLAEPTVLGLSCYMWNMRYAMTVARLAKEKFPDVLVVAGGPSVPRDTPEAIAFLKRHPAVDVLVLGEGERTFSELLRAAWLDRDFDGVDGIAWRARGSDQPVRLTPPRPRERRLGDFPSPFLDGTFDHFLEHNRSSITGAIWETNRGCPFSCTFCDWGQATQSKVYEFPRDRLLQELEWLARRQFDFVWATDANFGIRQRDLEIARDVAATYQRYGYPRFFQVSWVKNSGAHVTEIYDVLRRAGIRAPLTLSTQSFHTPALAAVKRRNIKLDTFVKLKHHFGERGVQTYTELILGLPEETYASFSEGIVTCLSPYPTDCFVIYFCRILENTELAMPEMRARYGIQTRLCELGIPRRGLHHATVTELEEIVVETAAMPLADWQKSFDFGFFLSALYNQRLAFVVLNFLRFVLRIDLRSYIQFVLAETTLAHSRVHRCLQILARQRQELLNGAMPVQPLPQHGDFLWEPHESCYLEAVADVDTLLADLRDLTGRFLDAQSVPVDEVQLEELFHLQSLLIPRFGRQAAVQKTFVWDWFAFLSTVHRGAGVELPPRPITIEFTPPPIDESSPEEFARAQIRVTRSGSRTICDVRLIAEDAEVATVLEQRR